jgi:hypothetical protein
VSIQRLLRILLDGGTSTQKKDLLHRLVKEVLVQERRAIEVRNWPG